MVNDILFDETGDLAVGADGDLVVGQSDYHHMAAVYVSTEGQYKQWPLSGFGAVRYVNAPTSPGIVRSITRQLTTKLQYDGLDTPQVAVGTDEQDKLTVKIDGEYGL